jgi:hypothetical protein
MPTMKMQSRGKKMPTMKISVATMKNNLVDGKKRVGKTCYCDDSSTPQMESR